MCFFRELQRGASWLGVLASAATLQAATKNDLARVTPVGPNEPIPAVDFLRQPALIEPRLNRAGTHLAARISAADDHVQLLVQDLATKKFEFLNGLEELDITWFRWLDDGHILFNCGSLELFVTDIRDLKMSHRVHYCFPDLVGVPENNRMRPLIWIRSDPYDRGKSTGVVALKAELADMRPVGWDGDNVRKLSYRELNQEHVAHQFPQPTGGLEIGYFCDKDGNLAFGATDKQGVITLHSYVNDTWQACPIDCEERPIQAAGNKAGEIVVLARGPIGTPSALQFMDAASGKLGDVLLQDDQYDVEGTLFRDPGSRDIVGVAYDRAAPTMVWFNEGYRALQKKVEAYFPDLIVRIIDGDREGKHFVLKTWSDRQPPAYFLLDVEKNTLGLIKSSAPWIDPKRMQPTNMFKYKTRDGQKMDAYLTMPPGASKANPVPLMVLPPPGLWNRASIGYHAETQYFVSRGYAVLQPNHRWSAGYAWMFPRDDEWAFDKMAQDINDATQLVLKSGLVDRRRVAIMGVGFSANLALGAVVNSPDTYQASIVITGVFDLMRFVKELKYYEHDDASYGRLVRKLGDPKRDVARLDAASPSRHIDQIRSPVLVAEHRETAGEQLVQSNGLLAELRKWKVPHEEVWVTGGMHGLQNIENTLTFHTRVEAFLAKHLPPTPATAAP